VHKTNPNNTDYLFLYLRGRRNSKPETFLFDLTLRNGFGGGGGNGGGGSSPRFLGVQRPN
jgi:hypothetical protein